MNMGENYIKNLVKGTTIILAGIILSKFISLIYRIIVARVGPYEFGLFSLGLTLFGFIGIIATFGLDSSLPTYLVRYKVKNLTGSIKKILTASSIFLSISSVFVAILLFVFSDTISVFFFHDQNLSIVLKILSFAIPFDVLRRVIFNCSKAFNKAEYEVYAKYLLENISKLIFTITFLMLGLGLFGLSLAYTFAVVLSLLLGAYLINKLKLFASSVDKIKGDNFKGVLIYSSPLVFASLLFMLGLWVDTIMIGYFMGGEPVGLYNAAGTLSQVMYIFPLALIGLFLPIATEAYAKNKSLKEITTSSAKWISLLGFMIISAFILFPKEIINLLFGSAYLSSSVVLLLLSINCLIISYIMVFQRILMILNRTKLISLFCLIGVIANIILNLILIKIYGINGAAAATLLSTILTGVLTFFFIRKYLSIKTLITSHIKVVFLFAIAISLTYLFNTISQYHLFFIGSLSFFVVLSSMLLLISKSLDRNDMMIFIILRNKYHIKLPFLENFIKKFI